MNRQLEEAVRASIPPRDEYPAKFEFAEEVVLCDGSPGLVLHDAGGIVTLYLLTPFLLDMPKERTIIVDRGSLADMLVSTN